MGNYKTSVNKASVLVAVSVFITQINGWSQTAPQPVNSTPLSQQQAYVINPSQAAITRATNTVRWYDISRVSASFLGSYTFQHSYQFSSDQKIAGENESLGIGIANGLSLVGSFAESESSIRSLANGQRDTSLSFQPSVDLGWDIGEFYSLCKNSNRDPATYPWVARVSTHFGYSTVDNDALPGPKLTFSQADGVSYGASLTAGRNWTSCNFKQVSILISPAYRLNDEEVLNLPALSATRTYSGNLSIKAECDVVPAAWPRLAGAVFATWLREINLSEPAGVSNDYQDWAQFGAGLTYNLGTRTKLSGNYTYTAFNTQYFSHFVSLQAQFSF